METEITPQILTIGGLVVFLLVLLFIRYFQNRQSPGQRLRYGMDHSQAIAEMGMRTRAEAERKEREERKAHEQQQGEMPPHAYR